MAALLRTSGAASFDGLYRKHAATVYRYCLAVLGNHADAEDVTQTTFMNAYRALAQGVKPRKAENWLLTIAHNQIRQHFRKTLAKPLEVELDEEAAAGRDAVERSEPTVADILRALQKLTPGQRSAIVMREFEGRSYAEMAEILGLTPSALEALLFRARRALAEELEDSLTCAEAELSLSRRLDGRLARAEGRRLKAHMRDCPRCQRFELAQRRQRKVLKGLSLMPVPASILLFRSETAAAAGLGAGAAGAGATAGGTAGALAGTGVAAGVATGVAAKVAVVGAAAAVAVGGVGYGVTKVEGPSSVDKAAALAQTRNGARAEQVHIAKAKGELPGPAPTASDRARAATAAAHAQSAKLAAAARKKARLNGNSADAKAAAEARQAARTTAKPDPQGQTKPATTPPGQTREKTRPETAAKKPAAETTPPEKAPGTARKGSGATDQPTTPPASQANPNSVSPQGATPTTAPPQPDAERVPPGRSK
jgi:RNA polymerase sigma-70 factor (ECF subfamily)